MLPNFNFIDIGDPLRGGQNEDLNLKDKRDKDTL